jgi:hypothetical protein
VNGLHESWSVCIGDEIFTGRFGLFFVLGSFAMLFSDFRVGSIKMD